MIYAVCDAPLDTESAATYWACATCLVSRSTHIRVSPSMLCSLERQYQEPTSPIPRASDSPAKASTSQAPPSCVGQGRIPGRGRFVPRSLGPGDLPCGFDQGVIDHDGNRNRPRPKQMKSAMVYSMMQAGLCELRRLPPPRRLPTNWGWAERDLVHTWDFRQPLSLASFSVQNQRSPFSGEIIVSS